MRIHDQTHVLTTKVWFHFAQKPMRTVQQTKVENILDIEEDSLWLCLGTEFSRWFDLHCVVDAVTADH